jgi:hypothetical protein
MPYEQRPNTGSLFSNRDHAKNPKAPTTKGNLLIEIGDQIVEIELAGWTRDSPKAGKWVSLAAKLKSIRTVDGRDLDAALGKPDEDAPF